MRAKNPFLMSHNEHFIKIRHILVNEDTPNGSKTSYDNESSQSIINKLSYFSKNWEDRKKDHQVLPQVAAKNEQPGGNGWFFGVFRQFCKDSSLHVIKYVADKRRKIAERAFWALMFIFSLCACGPQIIRAWDKFNDDSLAVVLQQSAEPIWKIPFPEVVICNEAVVRGDIIKQQKIDIASVAEFSLLCPILEAPNESRVISEEDFSVFIEKHHIPLKEFLFILNHKAEILNVSEYFTARMSDFGLCFSFNTLSQNKILETPLSTEENEEKVKYWDLEHGYSDKWFDESPVPKRALSPGATNAYGISLKRNKHYLTPNCSSPNAGFKVGVKNPADGVYQQSDFLRVAMGKQTNFLVTPKMVLTENATRSMAPAVRDCFFQDERRLLFFRFYTQKNCQAECVANITLAACNCVAYYMPRSKETPICLGAANIKCVRDVAEKFEVDTVKGTLRGEDETQKWGPCVCMPACTHLTYTFEVYSGDLMTVDEDFAYLTFYFKEKEFFPLVRVKQNDFLTFISTCGGLLGLFLGFSLLSLVEILYFLCFLPGVHLAKSFCS